MTDCLVLWNLKIEIYLHAAVVGVGRHGVPCAPGPELCHTHLELACRNHFLDQHSVDDTVVAFLQRPEFHVHGLCPCCQMVRICRMCRRTAEIEFCRIPGVGASESHLSVTAAQIEGFLVFHPIFLVPCPDGSLSSDIEDSDLPS